MNTTEKNIIKGYENGLSVERLRVNFKRCRRTIVEILRRGGITPEPRFDPHRKYAVNETAFDCLDNEQSLYWTGFIMAEGSVNRVSLRVQIGVRDIDHLEKMRLFLTDHPIEIRNNPGYGGPICLLSVNSIRMAQTLANYGIVKGRGNFIKLQHFIPNDLEQHFIRGFLDGDGCISTNHSIGFLGQPDILTWIKDILVRNANASSSPTIRQRKGICEISWGGKIQILRLANCIYKDATIWLERKRAITERW